MRPGTRSCRAGAPVRPRGSIYDSEIKRQGIYKPAREIGLEALYPIIEGYKNSEALGLHARFSDPIGFARASLTASYSVDDSLPSNERAHAAVRFEQARWSTGLNWNAGDFYDLFGPTKRSREGYNGFIAYDRPIVYKPTETTERQRQGRLLRRPGLAAELSEHPVPVAQAFHR